MDEIVRNISTKLKGFRAENGYTLEEMADKLSIHRETFRKYENNPLTMEVGLLLKIFNIYDIDAIYFFNLVYGKMPITEKEE